MKLISTLIAIAFASTLSLSAVAAEPTTQAAGGDTAAAAPAKPAKTKKAKKPAKAKKAKKMKGDAATK